MHTRPEFERYLSAATIGRLFGCDPRTATRRLTLAGLDPDAEVIDLNGRTSLWRVEKLGQLQDAITGASDPLNELRALCADEP